ncbi:hypothetical protein Tco_0492346 [Tanacetum coccineum]
MHFPHDFSFHQLHDFLLDCFVPIRCLPPSFLPYGLASFADVQAVFHYGAWNVGNVCRLPGPLLSALRLPESPLARFAPVAKIFRR